MFFIGLTLFLVSQSAATPATQPAMKGSVEASVQNPRTKKWRQGSTAEPGEYIRYKINYVNTGKTPVVGFVLRNAVPEGTRLIEKAEGKGCKLEYSIDRGSTFSAKPLKRAEGKEVEADPEEYTHLRCTQTEPQLKPGETIGAVYTVQLK